MVRYSRKLPIASAGGGLTIVVGEADWQRIESAYGKPLASAVRDKVFAATEQFVEYEVFERMAEPVANTRDLIKAYKKAGWNLKRAILTGGSSDAGVYAKHLVRKNFQDPRLSDNERFHSLSGVLTTFVVACEIALRELDRPSMSSLEGGGEWRRWIRLLTKIMRENSLPAGVRKDSDKRAKISPFVAFVRELQNCLPDECACPTHSDGALAEAIVRARAVVSGHEERCSTSE
jgi:hypothetical protein